MSAMGEVSSCVHRSKAMDAVVISGIKFTDGKQAVQKNVDNTQNTA